MKQEDVFLKKEGDNYFKRNHSVLNDHTYPDPVLYLAKQYGLKAKNILDIGCSNGSKLSELIAVTGGKGTGVEPGAKAISDGKKRFPHLTFKRGIVSKLPIKGKFDIVTLFYVLHWVSREEIFKAIAEIDRVVKDGGYLIIGDFDPDFPTKIKYHHLPSEEVYTYKLDYARIFEETGLYHAVARNTFTHVQNTFDADLAAGNRGVVTLLKKSLEGHFSS